MGKLFCGLFVLLASFSLVADEVSSSKIMECEINGCSIQCAVNEGELQNLGVAKSVKLTVYDSGVSEFELFQTMGKKSTIIVGPKSYLCRVTGQKN